MPKQEEKVKEGKEMAFAVKQYETTTPISWAREKLTIPNGYMKRFVKEHWTRIVNHQMYMLRDSENLEGKVWNIAPIDEFLKHSSDHLNNFFNYAKFLPRTQEFETRVRSISTDSVSHSIHIEKDERIPINLTLEQPHGSTITTVTSTAAAGQTVVDNPRRVIEVHSASLC
eukprot:768441-Hanusia_phi.AAC.14